MLPLSGIEFTPRDGFDPASWYLDVPAIAQFCKEGLDFESPVTVIVGENGSGKSTVVEAIASSWTSGMGPSTDALWSAPGGIADADLGEHLTCIRMRPQPYGGCFLRAETMHSLFEVADRARARTNDVAYNELSHGQSFLHYVAERPVSIGLWIMDEPEAALSFQSSLALMSAMKGIADEGSQVVLATHSPILASFPGADVIELDDAGFHRSDWDDLDVVRNWRAYLADPDRFLRFL